MTNPFSRLHGVCEPSIYAPRRALKARVATLFDQLEQNQFAQGLRLLGVRANGKTTELLRITQDVRARGWLPVRISVGFAKDNSTSIVPQIAAELTREIKKRGGRSPFPSEKAWQLEGWKAKGKLPLAELEIEGRRREQEFDLLDGVQIAINEHLVNNTPVVLLIDEADLLSVDQFESFIVPLLNNAAIQNQPFAVLTAGTTIGYISMMNGQSTFSDRLTEPFELSRLNSAEAFDLMIKTAAHGGQDWSKSEAIIELVENSRGVPGWLQNAGFRAFEASPRVGIEKALSEAARDIDKSRQSTLSLLGAQSLPDYDLVAALQDCLSTERMDLWTLRKTLKDKRDIDVEASIVTKYAEGLQEAGICEAHIDGTIGLF